MKKILETYGMNKYDAFELLRKSGGKLPIDNFEFVESKNARAAEAEATPYDFEESGTDEGGVNVDSDPFAEFGDSVSIDDNFLE